MRHLLLFLPFFTACASNEPEPDTDPPGDSDTDVCCWTCVGSGYPCGDYMCADTLHWGDAENVALQKELCDLLEPTCGCPGPKAL